MVRRLHSSSMGGAAPTIGRVIEMSNRGFILAFSVLALGASSVQADQTARRVEDRDYRDYDDWDDDDDGDWDDDDDDRDSRRRGRAMNARFRGMDRNRDGLITRAEWRGNDRSFRVHDRNGDGVLAGREVRANNGRRNRNRGDGSRVDSLGRLDRNRDGVISRGEWTGSRSDFDRLDRNRDGYVTSSEARARY